MVANLAIYTVVHQPRRLKFPAQPIPYGASSEDIARCLFDERLNEQCFHQVARECYYPAAQVFLELVRNEGLKLCMGVPLSFVQQAQVWEPALLELFRELIAEPNVELIGVEPCYSYLFLLDLPAFVKEMQRMSDELYTVFGKRPRVTDTTSLCMSAPLYDALDEAGFQGVFVDGSSAMLGWRQATYLYRNGDEGTYTLPPVTPKKIRQATPAAPYLLCRHQALSDDVAVRFSNQDWSEFPLYADTYAEWIARTPGDLVVLGWDFEVFGIRQSIDSGILSFLRALPEQLARRNIVTCTASELIEQYQTQAYYLPLSVYPSARDFLPDTRASQQLFYLMHSLYGVAKLTEKPELLELAHWLAQADHFLYSPRDMLAPVPRLKHYDTVQEQKQIYLNALHAMEPYLPARLSRRMEKRRRASKASKETATKRKQKSVPGKRIKTSMR
ncbi:glycosyl hydrolase family 57 [Thermosporothrix hazakensis]|jgi:alpha-amylase|uniref:Glycosyl hydrolase family 57 n=2 Tax=Thermosporothrix TaxID=768650 RepID=A0A326U3K3_THEHA|nr:hypothetical protein [Thermosporothrix hazakensis]PZW26675.1 glycosyl hydrolase family 57 [Thermosporothrix hazakensis]BBH89441.1 hypothetical protein KTC_41920 [Thermosporothrix sp. COM3]GCE47624.1 hypothetical protein KTH_24930 [Thermosporothrix hazakensis]